MLYPKVALRLYVRLTVRPRHQTVFYILSLRLQTTNGAWERNTLADMLYTGDPANSAL
jgi:hypothetical protein